ncbi:MAG: hydrogenase nickel incorporation protein HypB [Methylocystis sp.]|jgi:hydrogenase nickel incorporation protein HypB
MCGHCGCGSEAKATALDLQTGKEIEMESRVHDHDHGHDHRHAHEHGHGHEHVHADGSRHSHPHRPDDAPGPEMLTLQTRILAKNDAFADKNRAWFRGREILALNLVSSPGSGKTTLLERTIKDLKDKFKLFVVEGDQATARDGERIRAAGAAAVQINTGSGCHLEADMLGRALQHLKPGAGSIVMIENVGNLVCPALFDLGERCKVVIFSVTEGEDKPLKYPTMFGAASVMILNKIDLLPYVEFDVARAIANAKQINPDIVVLRLSGRTGEGFEAWYEWLRKEVDALRGAAFA